MIEKELKARIVHKHDTEVNWSKATNFIPKQGEIIIYDKDSNYDYERIKIGDGTTLVNNLPFYGSSIENILDGIANGSVRTSSSTTESTDYKLGTAAFAEGSGTKANGNYSHAEGYSTTASGAYSHAEGRSSTASGSVSHAEGTDTVASGIRSHAGGYGTIAKGDNQTAIGKYNVEDVSNKYAFIIGNGTSSTRKNAFTVDWSGNVESNGKKLATEEYADAATTTLQNTYVPNTRKVNGKVLNADITLTASDVGALPSTTKIPTKTSDLDNDSGFITSAPVTSVNGKTGAVTLSASDVGALPSSTQIPSISGLATETYVNNKVAGIVNSAPEALDTLNELAEALGDDPHFATTIATQIGNKVDKIEGKGLSTNDYTTAEKTKLAGIADNANNYIHPSSHPANIITQDSTHRFVTDTEKNVWNSKSDFSGEYKDLTNKPTITTTTMLASNWDSTAKTYSFETDYPKATYDLEIALDNTATSEQAEVFNGAQIVGSATSNVVKVYGDVPTVDIPVILKVVTK